MEMGGVVQVECLYSSLDMVCQLIILVLKRIQKLLSGMIYKNIHSVSQTKVEQKVTTSEQLPKLVNHLNNDILFKSD